MPTLIFGVVVLVLVLWALNGFSRPIPEARRSCAAGGGIGALAAPAFLRCAASLEVAIPLGLAGLGLLGWIPLGPPASAAHPEDAGQVSRVRSAFVEMELDHDTGAMRGTILAGRHQGVARSPRPPDARSASCARSTRKAGRYLTAYLDRREPGWREHAQDDAAAGRGGVARGKMTEEEAYQILGVKPGASAEEIGRAHRTLMKKLHPDQGGSTYLAARINEAKEVLLRRRSLRQHSAAAVRCAV